MELINKRIGLALSGGGMRAAIYHLGILKYLASAKSGKGVLFDNITSISSVSGASLCVGAILAVNNNKWLNGKDFLNRTLPRVREMMLSCDIQESALRRLPYSPRYWENRVEIIAVMLEKKWGIKGFLQDLPVFPDCPYWEINCTAFETGGCFRIRRDYMGGCSIGYAQKPNPPVSRMIAASAGFPVLIGPYTLKTKAVSEAWTKDKFGGDEVKVEPKYTLWDGGVYDNLGLEALYKIGGGLDSEIDFLIVSDASAPIVFQKRMGTVSFSNMKRLIDIATYQVCTLRRREFQTDAVRKGQGMYLRIGESAESLAAEIYGGFPPEQCASLIRGRLDAGEASRARNYPTSLRTPQESDFDLILRHGYETAECAHILQSAGLL
jgi:NTE family protein